MWPWGKIRGLECDLAICRGRMVAAEKEVKVMKAAVRNACKHPVISVYAGTPEPPEHVLLFTDSLTNLYGWGSGPRAYYADVRAVRKDNIT